MYRCLLLTIAVWGIFMSSANPLLADAGATPIAMPRFVSVMAQKQISKSASLFDWTNAINQTCKPTFAPVIKTSLPDLHRLSSWVSWGSKLLAVQELQLEHPVGTDVSCGFILDFANVNVGNNSSLTVRIRNTGDVNLTVTTPLTITGANANQFSITTQPVSPIAGLNFSDFVVRFTPTTGGAKTATISIVNNDSDENPCEITLTGTGVIPNDNCGSATALTVHPDETCSSPTSGVTTGATQSIAAITCNANTGNADDDVWYSFVATSTSHVITVDGAANMDAVIDLRSGACDGTNIGCASSTGGGGTEELTATGLTISSTYYVRVYDYSTGGGNFTICITTADPPKHFRSKGTGLWSDETNWEVSATNMAPWVEALFPPDESQLSITIQSGHTITNDGNLVIDQVTVASGGTLDVTGGSLTIAEGDGTDLMVTGTLINSTTSGFTVSSGAEIVIAGTYRHNPTSGGGYITSMTWNSGSTCEIIKATAAPGNLNQTYHHFTWASTNQGATTINVVGALKTINGHFNVNATGTGALRLTGPSPNTLNVGLDVSIAALATLDLGDGSATSSLIIEGSLTNTGTIDLMDGGSANGYVSLKASLNNTGTIIENTTGIDCRIIFNGTTTQSASFGTLTNRVNVELDNGTGVSLSTIDLTLGSSASLIFTNGQLILNGLDLILLTSGSTITGASASNYVRTNGAGNVQREVGTSGTLFPVGRSAYNPMTITRTSGTTILAVQVIDAVNLLGFSGDPVTTKVVNRTWDVSLVTGSVGTLSLTAQWNGSEEIGGFDRSQSYLSHFISGTGWVGDTPANASGSDPYTRTRTGITSLSPFAMGSAGSPLPIELTHFDAQPKGEQVEINWATSAEINNDYFSVQHSTDGQVFRELDQVKGAGTTAVPQAYSLMHDAPVRGTNYYRLQQVDFDGAFSYSLIRVVDWNRNDDNSDDWAIRPTVSNTTINLLRQHRLEGTVSYTIYTPAGRPVGSGSIPAGTEQHPVDISNLSGGPYFIQIDGKDGVWNGRFVKG